MHNLRYKTSKEIPVVFHNGSNYDYLFIIKELSGEFEGQFECPEENTEKNITFSASMKKYTENSNAITYKIEFIDSVRFVLSLLLNLADNFSEELHKHK